MRFLAILGIVSLIAFILMIFTNMTYGQWEEVPDAGTTLDFAGTFRNDVVAFKGLARYADACGWIGLNVDYIATDTSVILQTLRVRMQRDIRLEDHFALVPFMEARRDLESTLAIATGAYFQKVIPFSQNDMVFGVGSFVEQDQVRPVIESDMPVRLFPYWLAIVGTKYRLVRNVEVWGRAFVAPEGRFQFFKGSFDVGVSIPLGSQFLLNFQSCNRFDTQMGFAREIENNVFVRVQF